MSKGDVDPLVTHVDLGDGWESDPIALQPGEAGLNPENRGTSSSVASRPRTAVVSRCCVVYCRRPATVVHEVAPPLMDLERARRMGSVLRYEVCADHDADYFGRGRFLSADQRQRLQVDLVPR